MLHCSIACSITRAKKEHTMSATDKSSGVAAAIGAEIDKAVDTALREYAKAAQEAGEQQKKAFDYLAQQQSAFLAGWQKGLTQGFDAAKTNVDEVTAAIKEFGNQAAAAQKQAFDAFAEAQRVVLNYAATATKANG